tara:strand:- start:1011 stop:1478 length:468 start_codon:yes stop_codon:yes gene_type:complete
MTKINVIIQDKKWNKHIKNYSPYLNKRVKILDKNISFLKKKTYDFTLLLSGEKKIKYLNKNFRNKNKSTDILSFPAYNKKNLKRIIKNHNNIYLGDVIININKIKKSYSKKEFKYRFDELWIHGFIHLFGFQHKKHNEFIKMNKIEKIFLKLINK